VARDGLVLLEPAVERGEVEHDAAGEIGVGEPEAGAGATKKSRKLWGDGSGSFRTRGRYSAATVRGTRWLTQDTCTSTLTRVAKGVVSVRDEVKRKTVVLRAGKRYIARKRR
jgi:hypothetical protein